MNADPEHVAKVVDRAQALTSKLLGKATDASVEAFLAERKRCVERETAASPLAREDGGEAVG